MTRSVLLIFAACDDLLVVCSMNDFTTFCSANSVANSNESFASELIVASFVRLSVSKNSSQPCKTDFSNPEQQTG